MTNRERLIGFLGFSPSEESLNGSLLDEGLDGEFTYDPSQESVIKRAAIKVLKTQLSSANIRNENGFSHTYDRDAISKRISGLENEVNPSSNQPLIRGRKPW